MLTDADQPEIRYLVFKLTEVVESLTPQEIRQLQLLANKVADYRMNLLKLPMECLVVEKDWPEYEPTWAAIKQRINSTDTLE